MIQLDIEPYCHNCPDFVPDVRSGNEIQTFDGNYHSDTMVFCKHERRCAAVERYIRKEYEKCVHTEKEQ